MLFLSVRTTTFLKDSGSKCRRHSERARGMMPPVMCDMKYAPLLIYRCAMYKLVWKSKYKIVSSSTEISLLMHHSFFMNEMKPQDK